MRTTLDTEPSQASAQLRTAARPERFAANRQRMATVRDAFRMQRLARRQRALWAFYGEHNLFAEAHSARLLMHRYLRSACWLWRRTLAAAP